MDDNTTKLSATGIIWAACAVVIVGAFVTMSFQFGWVPILAIIILMTLAALAGTQMVWKRYATSPEEIEKAKRRSRIEYFLDTVDDRELAELRARLIDEQDGEMISLEELSSRQGKSK
jgi:hypothetical protein